MHTKNYIGIGTVFQQVFITALLLSLSAESEDSKIVLLMAASGGKIVMGMVVKGLLTGFVIVLPGMSGGTMLLLLGLYEKLMRDLSRMRILGWIPFGLGAAAGILLSGWAFAWLFETYSSIVAAFLLGSILASLKSVLGENYQPNIRRVAVALIGLAVGLLLAGTPMSVVESAARPNLALLLIGGALASATMILPGIPGSSVLIILGIYDNMMQALADLDWITLGIFIVGAAIGIFGLANALDNIYSRHRATISWLFSGLIVGAGRMLVPASFENPLLLIIAAAAGFSLVWWWGNR
jgi:putative membrane protein